VWGALPLSAEACALAGFKGIGETRPALAIAAVTVLLNVCLNGEHAHAADRDSSPSAAGRLFPFPVLGPMIARYGVAGAAWATNIAAALGCAAALALLPRRGVRIAFAPPSVRALRRIASIGAPLASSGLLFSTVYVALGRALSSLSPAYLAALGVGHRIEAMAYTMCEGFAVGTATVVGQWSGAQRPARARAAAGSAARVAVLSILPVLLLVALCAPAAVRLFARDTVVVTAAVSYLRIVAAVFPLMAVEAVYEGALTGVQQTLPVLVVGAVGNLVRVPLAFALLPRLGVDGVWWAIALSTLVKAPVKWLCFRRAPVDTAKLSVHPS